MFKLILIEYILLLIAIEQQLYRLGLFVGKQAKILAEQGGFTEGKDKHLTSIK